MERLIAKRTRLDRELHRMGAVPGWWHEHGQQSVVLPPDGPTVTPIDSALRGAVREHRDTPGAVITERDLRLYSQLEPSSDSPAGQVLVVARSREQARRACAGLKRPGYAEWLITAEADDRGVAAGVAPDAIIWCEGWWTGRYATEAGRVARYCADKRQAKQYVFCDGQLAPTG